MSHNKREDGNEIWEYNIVLLYPTNVQTNKAKVLRCKLATEAAGQFYRSRFEEYSSCSTIGSNNLGYWTFYWQRRRPCQKSIIGRADTVVISCITYQNGIGDESGLLLVLWLLIAESEAQKPSFITSWRRQGFGQLMLIMLIKQSTSLLLSHNGLLHCQDRLPGVDIYVQCPHKDPMAFCCVCGFLQINLQDTTAIQLLPKTIAHTICNKNALGYAWIVPESEGTLHNPSDATLFWFPVEHSQGGCAGHSCRQGWWFWLLS